ncbi:DUF1501 domain-containing protein [Candidatus Laterigemmans baculatus]|uniref:DUF1501 domain-containing protein n=1 Tax=Candidatus Laterigemmans baculatus TaxID=2770505 RepID=UPI001F1F4ACE|nr:DUF1501 domain-containing protein [Candidatus Laterigemmans baculatus]
MDSRLSLSPRRRFLTRSACGFGMLALADILASADPRHHARAGQNEDAGAGRDAGPADRGLEAKPPHFRPRAKRVIFLFMHGGPSHVDTFDYKPLLQKHDGESYPGPMPALIDAKPVLMGSPWKFRQRGNSGLWVSDLLPHMASVADELCVVRSVHSRGQSHGQAVGMVNTGSDNFVRPSVGAWISYGLGTENSDLPSYVAISPASSHGGPRNYGAAFLPAIHQATVIGANGRLGSGKIADLLTGDGAATDREQLELLQRLNGEHLRRSGGDAQIEGVIESYELAFRMQRTAPEVLRIEDEPQHVQQLYGIGEKATDNFGRQCLLARRLAEAGVRFIQVSSGNVWDQHGNLRGGHEKNALATDQPIAGLIRDLKQRGMLDDTLLLWGGEFGRTPIVQGKDGRDHNPQGFTMLLAGGGTRGGYAHGETDEFGYHAVGDRVHMHDLHATILHLLGLDHQRLVYPYAGRDFRLTDVYGRVVTPVLADAPA